MPTAATTIVIVVAAILLVAYDIYAVVRFGYIGTISFVILTDARAQPIIAFAAGLLCGHLFWSQP